MPITTTINYSSGASFTYDSNLIEFAGGAATLKSIIPASETFAANFTTDQTAFRSSGVGTGTLTGATVSGGKLVCQGGGNRYCDWSATSNADSAQTGCIRFRVTPNYSGAPANFQHFVNISQASGNRNNQILISHNAGGTTLNVDYYNSSGAGIGFVSYASFNPVAGTTYEIEFNYDFTSGSQRLFLDGVLVASGVATGTRSSPSIGLLRVGDDHNVGGDAPNFSLDDLQIFSTVQHTSGFATGYTLNPYTLTNPTVEVNSAFQSDDLLTFSDVATFTGSDLVKYQIKVDGVAKYWDGNSWENASGYAQTNTESELNTNVGTLLSQGSDVKLVAYLHSEDGSTRPSLTSATFTYDFYLAEPAAPDECIVYVWAKDILGEDVGITQSAKLVAVNDTPFFLGDFLIPKFTKTFPLDSSGYVESSIVQTGSNKITFSLTYKDGTTKYRVKFNPVAIPALSSASLSSFATIKEVVEE